MNNETQSKSLPKPVESAQASGIARRRLLRAGMAATPVVLTLSGRSAMAATGCTGLSPLAWTSLTVTGSCQLNSHTVTTHTLGLTPSDWQTATSDTGIGATLFKDIFTSATTNKKIYEILDRSITHIQALYAAAYCNAMTRSTTYAISVDELKFLYSNKKLVPTATIQLTDPQIEAFLKQTWGA